MQRWLVVDGVLNREWMIDEMVANHGGFRPAVDLNEGLHSRSGSTPVMIDDPSPWMTEYLQLYRQAVLQGRLDISLVNAEEFDAHLAELRRLQTLYPDSAPAQVLPLVLGFLIQRRRSRAGRLSRPMKEPFNPC